MEALEDAGVTTVQEDPGWNMETIREDGAALRKIEEDQRAKLEDHSASLLTGITGAWKHETGTGIAVDMIKDATLYDQDENFDVAESMAIDDDVFPPNVTWEQELLKTAKSEAHYEVLKERVLSKREFMLNAQDLGLAPTMGLQLVAEFGNIPNYFTFGLGGLAKASKMKRFLVSGAITGTANVAEEAFINQMYNDRTATDYVVAGAMGMGLGWLGTLGGKGDAKVAAHIDETGDNFGKTHMQNSVSEKYAEFKGENSVDTMGNLIKKWRQTKTQAKEARDVGAEDVATKLDEEVAEVAEELKGFSTVGAEQIDSIYKAFDPNFDATKKTPRMDEDNDFVQSAFAAHLAGDIPRADALPQSKVGLASMAQSTHESENPLARYMASILMEHPEGVGRWNDHTIALDADLSFQEFISTYAPEYQRLKAAWNVLAEQGDVKHTFDEAATIFTSGRGSVQGSSKQMDDILDEFDELYVQMNTETIKRLKENGAVEGLEDLDANHLSRGWDAEQFHQLRDKYSDEIIIETLQDSILQGHTFKKAHADATKKFEEANAKAQEAYEPKLQKAQEDLDALTAKQTEGDVSIEGQRLAAKIEKAAKKLEDVKKNAPDVEYKAPDLNAESRAMAQALYNRFLTRATTTTADANLLSSANRTLLNSALDDAKLPDAMRRHIDAVLDSMGRDQRANPMKHQMGMNLATEHTSGLRVLDFMHTDLGSTYASKTKYWLGRAAGAKKGIPSEDAFNAAIEQIKRHGSDRGQSTKEIKADVARLEAAWSLIKGQPIEDMSDFGMATMRVVRKAMATSALGKLGIVQAGETGRVMAAVGVQNILDTIPAMRELIGGMLDGRLDTATLKDIEDFALGEIGADHYMNHPDFRVDDFGHKISTAEKQLDRMSFWLSKASGWHAVHTAQKKFLMNGLAQKWHRELLDGTMTTAQLKDLGVPIHQIDGLRKMMKEHPTKIPETGAYNLNLGNWDPELRRTFALMLHRKGANAVQDIMVGETPLWINRGIGKFIGQFRTFSIAALGKQTVHDYRMYKEGDKEAALAMQFMIMTSTMAVLARVGFDAAVLPEKERKEYLARNLTPAAITFKMLNYHGQASPLVDMTEMIGSSVMPNTWGELTGTSMYRNGRGLTGRIPGVSYVNRAFKGATGVAKAVMPGESMSKSDWKAFTGTLPLSSWYGFHALNKRVITPALYN